MFITQSKSWFKTTHWWSLMFFHEYKNLAYHFIVFLINIFYKHVFNKVELSLIKKCYLEYQIMTEIYNIKHNSPERIFQYSRVSYL